MKKALLFFCVLLVSCDKSGPTEPGSWGRNPEFNTGHRVTYRWSFSMVDSLGGTISSSKDTVDVSVVSVVDTVRGLDSLVRVDVFSYSSKGVQTTWYQPIGADFVEVAYRFGSGPVPLAQPIRLTRGGRGFVPEGRFSISTPAILRALFNERMAADTIYLREDPRIVYRYPLSIGQKWASFTQPFLQEREVQAETTLVVNGIPEPCAAIKTTLPQFYPAMIWHDYVNKAGLRMRSLIFPGLMVTTTENLEGIYTVTAYEMLEVIPTSSLNP